MGGLKNLFYIFKNIYCSSFWVNQWVYISLTFLKIMVYNNVNIHSTALVREDCKIGAGTRICAYTNLYGCEVGVNCLIGTFVEIQTNAEIGAGVKVQSHSFICELVTVEDGVFIGHGVITINDVLPPSKARTGSTVAWKKTLIKEGALIGSSVTLFPVIVGEYAIIGAGSVVTKDVPAYSIVVGNPARVIGRVSDEYLEQAKALVEKNRRFNP